MWGDIPVQGRQIILTGIICFWKLVSSAAQLIAMIHVIMHPSHISRRTTFRAIDSVAVENRKSRCSLKRLDVNSNDMAFLSTCWRHSRGAVPSIHQRSRIEGRCQTSTMQLMQPLANKSTERRAKSEERFMRSHPLRERATAINRFVVSFRDAQDSRDRSDFILIITDRFAGRKNSPLRFAGSERDFVIAGSDVSCGSFKNRQSQFIAALRGTLQFTSPSIELWRPPTCWCSDIASYCCILSHLLRFARAGRQAY